MVKNVDDLPKYLGLFSFMSEKSQETRKYSHSEAEIRSFFIPYPDDNNTDQLLSPFISMH